MLLNGIYNNKYSNINLSDYIKHNHINKHNIQNYHPTSIASINLNNNSFIPTNHLITFNYNYLPRKFNNNVTLDFIEFKKAQNIQEAIKYGQEKLKIQSYTNFEQEDLDFLNWVNEGLTNIFNKFQGNIQMPSDISFDNPLIKNTKINALTIIYDNHKKILTFNKEVFYKNIDKTIKEHLANYMPNDENNYLIDKYFSPNEQVQELKELAQKFNNGELKTFHEKLKLNNYLTECTNIFSQINKQPMLYLKAIFHEQDNINIMKNYNVINGENSVKLFFNFMQRKRNKHEVFSYLNQLSIQDQSSILQSIATIVPNFSFKFNLPKTSEFKTLYHEMSHIQENPSSFIENNVSLNKKNSSQKLNFWLTNTQLQAIARSISEYATNSPSEFLAETFACILSGGTVSQKAMDLYKELGGKTI